jgi:hypothetical protein
MRTLAPLLLLLAACGSPPRPALSAEDERILRPVPDPPEGVQALVDRGDGYFVKAIGEPASALDSYARARSCYLEAQTHYSGLVPPPLLDRVRECVTRIAALQRRVHSSN